MSDSNTVIILESCIQELQIQNSKLETKIKQLNEIVKILIEYAPKNVLDRVIDKIVEFC